MFNYKKYEDTSIFFTKPIPNYGTYEKLGVYYKKNDKETKIILQTPPMFISYDVIEKEKNNTICISFSKKDISKNVKSFYNFINYLDKTINKLCIKKKKSWFKNNKIIYKPSLSNFKNIHEFISINLPKKKNEFKFDIYDEQLNKININQLNKNTEVSMIIELSDLYYGKQKVGCNWNVLQIKKYNTLNLNQCMIIDDEGDDYLVENEPIINTKYDKYFKMLKMGIPLLAVKNNMIRDGYNIDFINNLPNDIDKFKIKLNTSDNNTNTKNVLPSVTSLLSMKNLLKKAEQNKEIKKVNNDGFAPSLSDIKNILCKLKKPGEVELKNNIKINLMEKLKNKISII